jgi:hypothetical protein
MDADLRSRRINEAREREESRRRARDEAERQLQEEAERELRSEEGRRSRDETERLAAAAAADALGPATEKLPVIDLNQAEQNVGRPSPGSPGSASGLSRSALRRPTSAPASEEVEAISRAAEAVSRAAAPSTRLPSAALPTVPIAASGSAAERSAAAALSLPEELSLPDVEPRDDDRDGGAETVRGRHR